jgi:hypothetical protein
MLFAILIKVTKWFVGAETIGPADAGVVGATSIIGAATLDIPFISSLHYMYKECRVHIGRTGDYRHC